MSGGGGNNQGEPVIALFLFLTVFAVMGWLLWHSTREFWLDHLFRWMRYGELWSVNLFSHRYDACLDWMRLAPAGGAVPPPALVNAAGHCFGADYLARLPAEERPFYYNLSMTSMNIVASEAERYYRWILAFALTAVGLRVLFFSSQNKFMTKHTLESLIKVQSRMWPIIMPIVKFNPSKTGRVLGDKVPEKLPLFAEALSPEEWISWSRVPVVAGIPDRDVVRRAFIQQLGPRWTGIDKAPAYIRALYAAFALKGAQKRDESDGLLGEIALCWDPKGGLKLPFALLGRIDKIIHDPNLGGKVTAATAHHAWRTTAMLGVLHWARSQGGVLAPAQFLWLRAEDRALWYPLNNMGRRSFHTEGAGAMAHYMAERAAQKPLPVPRVETAVVTLNAYLHDPEKRPIPIPERQETVKA